VTDPDHRHDLLEGALKRVARPGVRRRHGRATGRSAQGLVGGQPTDEQLIAQLVRRAGAIWTA
jgi:hypothetical protein